jgi:hypothetical protein
MPRDAVQPIQAAPLQDHVHKLQFWPQLCVDIASACCLLAHSRPRVFKPDSMSRNLYSNINISAVLLPVSVTSPGAGLTSQLTH